MFMIMQYSAGLTALSLAKSPTLLQKPNIIALISSLKIANAKFGEFRVLLRLFGLLPIIQWYDDLSKVDRPASWYCHTLEKLQAISLLCYYPLEHASYFGSRGIITSLKPSTIARMSKVSCQFWAAYTVFKLAQIFEELRMISVQKSRAAGVASSELRIKERTAKEALIVNGAYFPMTLHWFVLGVCWEVS
jgi:hypothetical protein